MLFNCLSSKSQRWSDEAVGRLEGVGPTTETHNEITTKSWHDCWSAGYARSREDKVHTTGSPAAPKLRKGHTPKEDDAAFASTTRNTSVWLESGHGRQRESTIADTTCSYQHTARTVGVRGLNACRLAKSSDDHKDQKEL